MAIEDALHRISSAGYRVMNLFQTSTGCWQANVMDPAGKAHQFATDRDPERALHLAMAEGHQRELMWFQLFQASARLRRAVEGGRPDV